MDKTMDKILVIVGVAAAVFTVTMIIVYVFTGGIPDTLCTCFYSFVGGECGIMGVIKTMKIFRTRREWQEEDRKNGVKVMPYYGEDNETIETIVE